MVSSRVSPLMTLENSRAASVPITDPPRRVAAEGHRHSRLRSPCRPHGTCFKWIRRDALYHGGPEGPAPSPAPSRPPPRSDHPATFALDLIGSGAAVLRFLQPWSPPRLGVDGSSAGPASPLPPGCCWAASSSP